jgi:lysophospholipase L1-like esterase
MQYTEQVARTIDAEVFNQGTGGEQYMAKKIVHGSYPQVDFITVAYGTNDWSKNPREILEGKALEFFEKLICTYPGIPVYYIIPIWRRDCDRITLAGTFPEARERLRQIASKYPQVICIDGLELTPHVEEFYSDNYLHPNDLGFCLMAENLLSKIRSRLPGI